MVVVAGFATGALVPEPDPVRRVLGMAIAVGVLTALVTDWRACLGVMVTAVLVFVTTLAPESANQPGEPVRLANRVRSPDV
jgi:hypothetical protein